MTRRFTVRMLVLGSFCAALGCSSRPLNRPAKAGVPPSPASSLRLALLGLARDTAPWIIRDGSPERTDLVIEWKIADAKWSSIFSAGRVTKVYKVSLLLDEATHTVRTLDEESSFQWAAGGTQVTAEGGYFIGQQWSMSGSYSSAPAYTETDAAGTRHEYSLKDAAEMKDPVFDTIVERGWSVQAVFGKQAVTRAP